MEGGRDQRLGVVGLRPLENLLGRPVLDDLAVAHDDDVVGQRPHDLEVVADEEIGEVVLRLQVAQQVDDLRLHAHVERRGRLVEHDEARLQHHGAGDGDALPLAAGEFMRIAEARLRDRGRPPSAPRRPLRRVRPARATAHGSPGLPRRSRATDMRGLSEPNGSWKTICISRRSGRIALKESRRCRVPMKSMRPSDEISRASARPSVVLPEPDSPTTPSVWPARTVDVDAVDRLHMADGPAEEALLDREPDLDVVACHHGLRRSVGRRRLALRLGGQQMARIGVLRVGEDLARRARLDDLALGHHADAVGDLAHDAEIVGDEQHRHALLLLSSASSSRICACTVTSSAVVGSSAISSSGSLASAMAIITRWRWPPDSWCG